MVDRAERTLTEADLTKIAGTYHAWRGTASAREANLTYQDPASASRRTWRLCASMSTRWLRHVMSTSTLRSPWSRQRCRGAVPPPL
ncbi:hypothetical protein OG301_32780 [Streptomyces platensis]|nr:hypothetical protein OG301_32780 [Streptomyces platensis]